MTFDMNDVEPQQAGDLIPDGTFAKVVMTLRKGGTDGTGDVDRGLLKSSNQPGSCWRTEMASGLRFTRA